MLCDYDDAIYILLFYLWVWVKETFLFACLLVFFLLLIWKKILLDTFDRFITDSFGFILLPTHFSKQSILLVVFRLHILFKETQNLYFI